MKFLIVKTSSLGDIIQAFPSAGYLHQQFPEAEIHWVVEKPFAQMVQAHPHVTQVHTISTKKWRQKFLSKENRQEMVTFKKELKEHHFDAVFDMQSNIKSSLITWLANSPVKVGFGWKTVHEWPNLFVTNRRYDPVKGLNICHDYLSLVQGYRDDKATYQNPGVDLRISVEEKEKLQQIVNRAQFSCKVLVCAGSMWRNKQLDPKTLSSFLGKVQEHLGCSYLFAWGSPEEQKQAQELQSQFPNCSHILEKMSLPMLQNLMGQVNLVIAMDSLPLHLAGTTKTPTFSVFGASAASKFKPEGAQHRALQGVCPYGRTFEKRCPILRTCKTGACIRDINPDDLIQFFINPTN